MAKKRLPTDPSALEGTAEVFFNSLRAESDRGCVLVAAAFLDEALELLLRGEMSHDRAVLKHTIDLLYSGVGPLRSFGVKLELARALKLIPEKTYADLTCIRALRNHFAHSYVDASFADTKAQDLVSRLIYFGTKAAPPSKSEVASGINYRRRFSTCASWHAGAIHKNTRLPGHGT